MDPIAHRAPWYVAGPLMGVAIVGLRALVNKPLGVAKLVENHDRILSW